MIGGESAIEPFWVTLESLPWLTIAREHGALVMLLEHRYYGESRPTRLPAFILCTQNSLNLSYFLLD
jgi:hypothetical protein